MSCSPDELEPPWARDPRIQLGSIGWRMGSGEGYMIDWSADVEQACPTVEVAVAYLHRHPPAPRTWRRWIASWLAEISGEEASQDEAEETASPWDELVETEELTADDAAYPVAVRNATDGVAVPWARPNVTPQGALRYSARETGWWARWLVTECPDRGAYLDSQPTPPPAWSRIASSARTGVAEMADGIEGALCTLAATGVLPPAWLGDKPPRPIEWAELADERDHWLWWVSDTFDDPASWRAYVAKFSPPSPEWKRALEEDYLGFA